MFALTQGAATHVGFPDTCNTPLAAGAPIPVPYADIAMGANCDPAAETVSIESMSALNQLSMASVSNGNEAGCELGCVSLRIDGGMIYMVGCITVFFDGVPAQRLTSVTGQNGSGPLVNAPGMACSPSQCTVLTLG